MGDRIKVGFYGEYPDSWSDEEKAAARALEGAISGIEIEISDEVAVPMPPSAGGCLGNGCGECAGCRQQAGSSGDGDA